MASTLLFGAPPAQSWVPRLPKVRHRQAGAHAHRVRQRQETAQVLGIEEAAASKRYIRALEKLKKILADLPGGLEGI